jgi:hypothetical protein
MHVLGRAGGDEASETPSVLIRQRLYLPGSRRSALDYTCGRISHVSVVPSG